MRPVHTGYKRRITWISNHHSIWVSLTLVLFCWIFALARDLLIVLAVGLLLWFGLLLLFLSVADNN